jgi:peptide methionine sulfoxide reductase MsrA
VGKNKEVCYHNLRGLADYGSLGHGEVVQVKIPTDKYADFAQEYISLFASDLDRPDKGDRGPEYRSLVGLPGGVNSPLYPSLAAAAEKRGLKLVQGNGNDADTLFKQTIWVMDSDKFPFYQAEVYHQYHGNVKFILYYFHVLCFLAFC